jgi:glycosyltransferase involved in cell wall biosynthesis
LRANFYPIRRPFHIHQQIAPTVDLCDFSGDPDVAIVHVNPDGWPGALTDGVLTESQIAITERAKVRICLAVCEMTALPPYWRSVFDKVDAVWAPSRYCASVFETITEKPVDVIPHVVAVHSPNIDPSHAASVRRELSLLEHERIILYAFDASSYLARKNPFALIRAFARSCLADSGWRLVLKTKHISGSPGEGKRLQEDACGFPGVILIDRSMNTAAMGELMGAADVYASPHCAEGFGLTIAEAMAMGKIVVATDYGGSRDFLDGTCGFPVNYRLEELDVDHGPYARGAVWAQVDEDHLTDSLIRAAELSRCGDFSLGDAAQHRVGALLSPAAVSAKMRESLIRVLRRG